MTLAVILLGLLVGLAGPAAARKPHRQTRLERVYRDCSRDGRLNGHYKPKLLRRALREMPADLQEYSSCPDQIRTALRHQSEHKHKHAQKHHQHKRR